MRSRPEAYPAQPYMSGPLQQRYASALDTLRPYLPQIVASFSDLHLVSLSTELGEYAVNRVIDGETGSISSTSDATATEFGGCSQCEADADDHVSFSADSRRGARNCHGGVRHPYYTAAPIEAWVVDADTGAPVEGAVVTANWQLVAFGFDTGGRKVGQLEVMETATDKNGRFTFPGFTKVNLSGSVLREEDPQILIFKSGYRYMRGANDYPIGKEGEQGPHRKASVIGQTLKMQKADRDVRKYAFNLGFLSSYLSRLTEHGGASAIPRMIRALGCERQRLADLIRRSSYPCPVQPRLR